MEYNIKAINKTDKDKTPSVIMEFGTLEDFRSFACTCRLYRLQLDI